MEGDSVKGSPGWPSHEQVTMGGAEGPQSSCSHTLSFHSYRAACLHDHSAPRGDPGIQPALPEAPVGRGTVSHWFLRADAHGEPAEPLLQGDRHHRRGYPRQTPVLADLYLWTPGGQPGGNSGHPAGCRGHSAIAAPLHLVSGRERLGRLLWSAEVTSASPLSLGRSPCNRFCPAGQLGTTSQAFPEAETPACF